MNTQMFCYDSDILTFQLTSMHRKLNNLLHGVGSVIAICPQDRDLSVASTVSPSTEEAFARDAAALLGDFERAFEQDSGHAKEAKAEQK